MTGYMMCDAHRTESEYKTMLHSFITCALSRRLLLQTRYITACIYKLVLNRRKVRHMDQNFSKKKHQHINSESSGIREMQPARSTYKAAVKQNDFSTACAVLSGAPLIQFFYNRVKPQTCCTIDLYMSQINVHC